MPPPILNTRNRIVPFPTSLAFTAREEGLVPAPLVLANKFLRDDATWQEVDSGSGGDVEIPTGTGFTHITGGVQDAAAQLVFNADVSGSAAIVESKLALNFPTHTSANDPTASEKAALAGTDGIPSGINPYVTDSDPRLGTAVLADDDYGDVTISGTGTIITIDNDTVTYAKIQNVSTTDRILGRDTAGAGDIEELTVSNGLEFTGTGIQRSALTGDVTAPAGSNTTTIPASSIDFPKMRNINQGELLGRHTAGTGEIEQLGVDTPLEIIAGSGLLSFNAVAVLANNARVAINENGTGVVGTRRGINFIEGDHVSFTITDDALDEEVDVEIDITNVANALHASQHETGGSDEMSIDGLTGRSATTQLINVLDNGVSVANRPGINFISGTGITLTITAPGGATTAFDVEIEATGGGGSGLDHPEIMSRISLRM